MRGLCLWLLALSGAIFVTVPSYAESRPNVVFILADDQGWNDIGYHNPELRTPHLDQLAREGVELDAHYVQPQCTPTRVAIMTGRYPSRFGKHCLTASNAPSYPIGTPTLARMFKDAGYTTALIGKWHMGSTLASGPNHHGFDYSYGCLAGAVGVYDHRYRIGDPHERSWHRDLDFVDEEGNAMDLLTADAVRWIEANAGKPFYAYLPFTAVHTPLVPKEEWLAVNAHIADEERRVFAAVLSQLDDSVGKVVAALERAGVRENTLIIYSSDNGAQVDHKGGDYPPPDPVMTAFSSNAPLRGKKTEAYEGGIRVPAFANWPGHLKPGKLSVPMHAVDWFPTLAAAIGAKAAPANADGFNTWPVLCGDPSAAKERSIYEVWGQNRAWEALRRGDWKIVRHKTKGSEVPAWELYSLAVDPNESTDLAAQKPEKVRELAEHFASEAAKDAPASAGPT